MLLNSTTSFCELRRILHTRTYNVRRPFSHRLSSSKLKPRRLDICMSAICLVHPSAAPPVTRSTDNILSLAPPPPLFSARACLSVVRCFLLPGHGCLGARRRFDAAEGAVRIVPGRGPRDPRDEPVGEEVDGRGDARGGGHMRPYDAKQS